MPGFDGLPELLAKTERIYPVAPARRRRRSRTRDRLRLLFVGRDFMRKGGPVLLRAHAALRAQGIPVESTVVSVAAVVGRRTMSARRTRATCGGDARALGAGGGRPPPRACRSEVYALMEAADYLVFPTFHDTFGFVAIESLAAGTPVIATDTCVLPEVVEPGGTAGSCRSTTTPSRRQVVLALPPGRARLSRGLRGDDASARRRADRTARRRPGRTRAGYEALSAGALAVHSARFDPEPARRRLEALYERLREASLR